MKKILVVALLMAMMGFFLVGCMAPLKVEKRSQAQIASDPNFKPASVVKMFNRYEGTCVQAFVFRGNLRYEEMYAWNGITNLIIITDRLVKTEDLWLEPALGSRDPSKKFVALDLNRTFTALGIIRGGGKGREGPFYKIERHVFRTTSNPFRNTRNGLQRGGITVANKIIEFGGTNASILEKLYFDVSFYPNRWVRRTLGAQR